VDGEVDEEVIHLAKIGGVAVRVEKSGRGHGVANVHGEYLSSTARGKLENFDVLAVREGSEQQKTSYLVLHHLVRCWVGWEERQLSSH